VLGVLDELTPVFFYFDEYSSLPGTIRIREVLAKEKETLDEEETTARHCYNWRAQSPNIC